VTPRPSGLERYSQRRFFVVTDAEQAATIMTSAPVRTFFDQFIFSFYNLIKHSRRPAANRPRRPPAGIALFAKMQSAGSATTLFDNDGSKVFSILFQTRHPSLSLEAVNVASLK
jgi:hypothetical protein